MSRPKRKFTPEQKANIVNQIEADQKNGLSFDAAVSKHDIVGSLYIKWKRQLKVDVRSSLRNGKAPVDAKKNKLMSDIKKLQKSLTIAELKKS